MMQVLAYSAVTWMATERSTVMPSLVPDAVILDAVLATVAECGYTGATTRQMADRAGVNEVTLFRRFGDKQTLVQAAVRAELEPIAMSGVTPTGDLRADLLRVLQFYVNVFRDRGRLLLVLMVEASRRPELAEVIREPLLVIARLRDLIATYQDTGQLVHEEPATAVNALVGPLLASAVTAQLDPTSTTEPPSASELLELFLHGHAARRSGTPSGRARSR
jgi:AcrR family transcriptional regulator